MTDAAKRIQLSRRKGYRKPAGAVVVARPSRWGNPYKVGQLIWNEGNHVWVKLTAGMAVNCYLDDLQSVRSGLQLPKFSRLVWAASHPLGSSGAAWIVANIGQLRGKDLACWCKLTQPCHADVLLALGHVPEKESAQ